MNQIAPLSPSRSTEEIASKITEIINVLNNMNCGSCPSKTEVVEKKVVKKKIKK